MAIWNNCVMTNFFYEGSFECPCVVKIDGDFILVEYEEDGEIVRYEGNSIETGHYELNGVGFDGYATLHRFLNSDLFEGSWIEEGSKGMWKIELA